MDKDKWLLILQLRAQGKTLAECGQAVGLTRQRAHAIIKQARSYAKKHNDGLAQKIGFLFWAIEDLHEEAK